MSDSVEQVIVTEQGTVVVSNNNTEFVISNSNSSAEVVITGLIGPPGTSSLTNMTDIDKTDLTDGATLVYKASTSVWRATNKLDNQILEAGQF